MALPGENIQNWSTTASNNANADDSINWAEGQPRASVNNSARSMMAAHAKDRNLKNGSITTGGTANAQTFTSGVGYTTVPTGLWVKLKIGVTNTGATTLNMDSIGAVAIKDQAGTDLSAGALTIGRYVDFIYDGTNWKLMQAVGMTTTPQCGRLEYNNATTLEFRPFNGDLIKINGILYQIPSNGIAGLHNTSAIVDGLTTPTGTLVGDSTYLVFAQIYNGVITAHFYGMTTPPTSTLATHGRSTQAGNIGTEILVYNGVEYNDMTLIGMCRTNSAAQFFSQQNFRWVISWFNRRNIGLYGANANGTSTTSATVVELNASCRCNFITWGEEAFEAALWGTAQANVAGGNIAAQIVLDGSSLLAQNPIMTSTNVSDYSPVAGGAFFFASEGVHYVTPGGVSYGPGAWSGIFYCGVNAMIRG